MTALETDGYVVIKVFEPEEMKAISDEFVRIVLTAPELKQPNDPDIPYGPIERLVMGSVGYCPFASVAYHPFVRHINKAVYEKALTIFSEIIKPDEYFSMLSDRPLVRFPWQVVVEKGKWHQDDAANANAEHNDACYGGWINLNHNETQYFKAIPGTHIPDHPIFGHLEQKNGGRRGYANFKEKKDYDFLEDYWKTHYGNSGLIQIPPGHVLIFRETMIHTVFKNPKTKNCILRMHTSFMTSRSPVALHDRPTNKKYARPPLRKYIEDQMPIPVRSGQTTPVYSPLNLYPKNRPSLEALSARYIDECRDHITGLVLRELPSMQKLQDLTGNRIQKHPAFTALEIGLYIPHKIQ